MKFTHGKSLMIPYQRVSFCVNNFDLWLRFVILLMKGTVIFTATHFIFSSNLWWISSNRDLFPAPDFFFAVFFEWVRNSKPTKASFFQKWLRERLLRYFSFQAIFEDGASVPNWLPRDEAKNVGNGRLKWYFCKGLNIHIFIRLMVQKSGDHHLLGMKPS